MIVTENKVTKCIKERGIKVDKVYGYFVGDKYIKARINKREKLFSTEWEIVILKCRDNQLDFVSIHNFPNKRR